MHLRIGYTYQPPKKQLFLRARRSNPFAHSNIIFTKMANCSNTKSKKLSIAKRCQYWKEINVYVLKSGALNVTRCRIKLTVQLYMHRICIYILYILRLPFIWYCYCKNQTFEYNSKTSHRLYKCKTYKYASHEFKFKTVHHL